MVCIRIRDGNGTKTLPNSYVLIEDMYDPDNQSRFSLAIVGRKMVLNCAHYTVLANIIPHGTLPQYFSSFAAGVSRISISSYGAASSMKTSRLPLPQQQQQQQQGGKRSTSMGPRERSLNRNPLPSLTPVGRKCK
jgi:hypothetical protein